MPDLEKLLGGYATGTLTEEERKALFEAALDDQQLFDALADEEALKEILDDPESRRRLLETLAPGDSGRVANPLTPVFEWLSKPSRLALAGSIAVACVAILIFVNVLQKELPEPTARLLSETKRSFPTASSLDALPPERPRQSVSPPPPAATLPTTPQRPADLPPSSKETTSRRPGKTNVVRLTLKSPTLQGPARQAFRPSEELRQRAAPAAEAARPSPDAQGSSLSAAARLSRRAIAGPIGLALELKRASLDGTLAAIDPWAALEDDAAYRLVLETNIDGHLYVLEHRADGWRRIQPFRAATGRAGPVQADVQRGRQIQLPLMIGHSTSTSPGRTNFFLVLSRNEIPVLDGSAATVQNFFDRWRSSEHAQSALVEQVGKTIYVAAGAPNTTEALIAEIEVELSSH